MNLKQLLLIFKARYKIILITFLVITLATLVISLILPSRYTAMSSVVVDMRSIDPIGGNLIEGPVTPSYLPTQVDIINSDRTALKVVKTLRLAENPAVRRNGGSGWRLSALNVTSMHTGPVTPWSVRLPQALACSASMGSTWVDTKRASG